jgi:ribose transport system substrate-binding protein
MPSMAQPCTLAVFTKNRVNPAYAAARLAADRVAAEAGARTIHYVPETPDDVGQQKVLVGEAVANRPDAVVFVPTDDAAMVEDVRCFEAAGIPVVNCINRMEGRFVSFVGSDDVAVGYTAARALIDGLGGKGDIVVIEGSPGAPTARDRAVGLRRALDESPAIHVLGSGTGAFQEQPARLAMARLLAQHPHIDGVWTGNDLMAFGALDALTDAGRRAQVVGINGLPCAISAASRCHRRL